MNIDIRLRLDVFDHPKLKKLRRRLGSEGVESLIRLWLWTAASRCSGRLTGLDVESVELAASWDGEEGAFVRELCALRLLDEEDGTFVIHDWADHQIYASQSDERSRRARAAAKVRWHGEEEDRQIFLDGCGSDAASMREQCPSMRVASSSNAPRTKNRKPGTRNQEPVDRSGEECAQAGPMSGADSVMGAAPGAASGALVTPGCGMTAGEVRGLGDGMTDGEGRSSADGMIDGEGRGPGEGRGANNAECAAPHVAPHAASHAGSPAPFASAPHVASHTTAYATATPGMLGVSGVPGTTAAPGVDPTPGTPDATLAPPAFPAPGASAASPTPPTPGESGGIPTPGGTLAPPAPAPKPGSPSPFASAPPSAPSSALPIVPAEIVEPEQRSAVPVLRGRVSRRAFVPPEIPEVHDYCQRNGFSLDAGYFVDYYRSRGWMLGKGQPMRDWQAVVRLWVRRDRERAAREASARAMSGLFPGAFAGPNAGQPPPPLLGPPPGQSPSSPPGSSPGSNAAQNARPGFAERAAFSCLPARYGASSGAGGVQGTAWGPANSGAAKPAWPGGGSPAKSGAAPSGGSPSRAMMAGMAAFRAGSVYQAQLQERDLMARMLLAESEGRKGKNARTH